MTKPDEYSQGAASFYSTLTRERTGVYWNFNEYFLRLPKKDPFDAIMILGAQLNHRWFAAIDQDTPNSFIWRGFSKKARSLSHMVITDIDVAISQPSSIEDSYTEIQSCISLIDHGHDYMPGLADQGVIAFGWRRLLLSTQGLKVGSFDSNACVDCTDVQNIIHDKWMAPNNYQWKDGLPCRPPLAFYHHTFEFGNTYGKQAYVMWKLYAKVRFLASGKSLEHGE